MKKEEDHGTALHVRTLHVVSVLAKIHQEVYSLCFNAVSSSGPRCLAVLHKKLHLLDNAVLLLTLQHWASFVYAPSPKPMANVLFPVLCLLSGTTGLEL